jgi:hypothetical protein
MPTVEQSDAADRTAFEAALTATFEPPKLPILPQSLQHLCTAVQHPSNRAALGLANETAHAATNKDPFIAALDAADRASFSRPV